MTMANLRSGVALSQPPQSYVPQIFDNLYSELVSAARTWAADEFSTAMAHELSDPLTALLLYLHQIKDSGEHSTGANAISPSIQILVESALCETQRVCAIMRRGGQAYEPTTRAEPGITGGHEAFVLSTRRHDFRGSESTSSTAHLSDLHVLTSRERQVLDLIISGAPNKVGAHQLGISTRTFEVHRAHIMKKLGVRNTADLVRKVLSEAR